MAVLRLGENDLYVMRYVGGWVILSWYMVFGHAARCVSWAGQLRFAGLAVVVFTCMAYQSISQSALCSSVPSAKQLHLLAREIATTIIC